MVISVKLVRKEEIAEGTMTFFWQKPPNFVYLPGQHADWTLSNPPETDAEGNLRTFSLASAPYEDNLIIATRLRDTAFKRVLRSLSPGTEVQINGPKGKFILESDVAKPVVMLAGGIGITPFRSMIVQSTKDADGRKICLFYSNRREEDAAFFVDLHEAQAANPNFKFIPTMTQPEKGKVPWFGQTGYINKEMLQKYLTDLTTPTYYIAGPPTMVKALQQVLVQAGIDLTTVHSEDFDGYD